MKLAIVTFEDKALALRRNLALSLTRFLELEHGRISCNVDLKLRLVALSNRELHRGTCCLCHFVIFAELIYFRHSPI